MAATTRKWIIYALTDPETEQVRYVGVTHRLMSARMAEHISNAVHNRTRTHCSAWIRSLIARGARPIPKLLQAGTGAGWQQSEQEWIRIYREGGADLTNHTDGGEGTPGLVSSDENKIRIKALGHACKGRKYSEASKKAMRDAQIRRFTWEQENGISRVRGPISEETRERISKALTGKPSTGGKRIAEKHQDPTSKYNSPEYREKLRQATLSRPAEQRAAFAKNQAGATRSEETKRRMSEAKRGIPRSEETKRLLREANLGKKQSEETIRKRAEACRKTWQKKKELNRGET